MPTRKAVVLGIGTLVAAIMVATAVGGYAVWVTSGDYADRLVAVGDVMVASTLLLTAIAVAVGVAAYQVTVEAPELEPEITFRCSEPNRPVFLVEPEPRRRRHRLVRFRQVEASVRIHNRGSASARNPAMRIDLVGMGGVRPQLEWRPTDWSNHVGVHAVQWDGGANLAIHGNGTRVLPDLSFENVFALADHDAEFALQVTLAAEGFRRVHTLSVDVRTRDAYSAYCGERATRYEDGPPLPDTCGVEECDRQAAVRLLVLHPEHGPREMAACRDCADGHEDFQRLPSLRIVDNRDRRIA
ncbi:MAG: hypothetical protein E6J41_15995 [Chloroflexi bacterium]|nr:MAG: hypothetical protein E6J41_15995 [Chloroflexota bacterium]